MLFRKYVVVVGVLALTANESLLVGLHLKDMASQARVLLGLHYFLLSLD